MIFDGRGKIRSVGVVTLSVLACVLRATTEKRSVSFLRKKVHSPEKILATPMIT